jgi:hypothetical protein
MDDVQRAVERRSELALEGDELRQVGGRQPEIQPGRLDRAVERAAERDIGPA